MSGESRSRSRSPVGLIEESEGDGFNEEDEVADEKHIRPKNKKAERNRGSKGRGNMECRVYVSNIPYEFKWQDLKDLFREEVGTVAFVEMFTDDSGRPRGTAVVEFESREMAQKAVDIMHRFEVKGRQLNVKERKDVLHAREFNFLFNKSDQDRGSRFSRDRPSPFDQGPRHNWGNTFGLSTQFLENLGINGPPLVNKVFVANLDYKVNEENLRDVFKVAGKVTDVEVMKDTEGKSRGFAVVEFEHPVQAVQAISMLHNQSYFDRRLNVRMDRLAEKKDSSSKLPTGLKGLGMGLGASGEAVVDVSKIANPSALNSQLGSGFNLSAIRPNINPAMALMGMAGISQLSNVLSNPSSLSIDLSSLASGGMNVMGNSSGLGTNFNQGSGGGGGVGGGSTGTSNMYSSNSNSSFNSNDRGGNFGGNSRNVVQISNLPADYTWQSLKDLCRNYGDIRYAEIQNKGSGLVRYGTEAEARRAADMLDQQRFDGRMLDARVV